MWTLGQPLAVEPKRIPSSLMPRPQVLLLLDRTNSRADPSERNRNTPIPKRTFAPPGTHAHLFEGLPDDAFLGPSWLPEDDEDREREDKDSPDGLEYALVYT